jgi:hypothetical protein
MKDFKDLRDHAFSSLQRLFFEEFDAELTESKIVLDMPEFDRDDVVAYLDEEGVEWEEKEDGTIEILDPVEQADIEVEIEAEEDDIEESVEIDTEMLGEAAARRKIVVRKGKKKIIFKCGPGMMKRGPRLCVRRPGSQLRKMKLKAKRSARKGRSKRNVAKRRRKISMRKRLSFGLRPRKSKKRK